MKRFTLLLSAMLLACATSLWAATATYQHVFTTKPSTGDNVNLSGVSWTVAATNLGGYNSNNYAGVQFGTSKANGSITLTSSSDWNYEDNTKITEVRLWLNLGGTSVTPSVTIGGKSATSDGTTVTQNKNAGSDWTKATKVTFTPAVDGNTGVVVINVTSVKAGYICAMEIDCEAESSSTATLTALTISGTPNKTNYEEGETFDPTGLVVKGTYDDSSTKTIIEGITWETDPDPLTAGTTAVDVKASVKNAAEVVVISDTYTVTGLTVTASLTSIAVSGTPDKINYKEGDTFDPTGLVVTGTYSDNSTKTITEGITWTIDPDVLTAGTTSVSVEATLNGVTSDPFKVENIVVTAPQPGDEVTVTFEAGIDIAAAENAGMLSKDGITLTGNKNSNGNQSTFALEENYRIYKGCDFTITSTQGKVTSVVLTATATGTNQYGPGNYTVPEDGVGYTFEAEGYTGTWTGSASEVVLSASGAQVRMTKVVVTYVLADPNTPDAPVISGETTFHGSTEVTITAGENLKIYYTTNGDEPTTASTLYNAPFAITATTTVKAIAVNATSSVSDVAEKTFTHQDAISLSAIDYTTNGTKVFLLPVTVVYANGAYTYLKDETGVGLLYGGNFNLNAGDMVTGLAATTTVYKELPELVPTVTREELTVTSGDAPSPAEAKAVPTAEEVNMYLLLKGVTLAKDAATKDGNDKLQNVTATFKTGTIDLRDQFGVVVDGTIKAGSYDVEGFVSVYNTTVQFYITKITSTATAIDNAAVKTPAIKTIENGQLIILRDGKKYNAMGTHLQ